MMRSLYSAVSGLQNHQTRMDVIGNNVSNVNTTGFKKGRVTFQDILSQTLTGAARPTDERGGINPKQVGLGMAVASIDTIMTQGSIQTTGKNTDLAITGEGFFILNHGDRTFYSRAGNFLIDRDGYFVNPNGLKVQGWNAVTLADGERHINHSAPLEDVRIPLMEKLEARATTIVNFKSNLNFDTPVIGPGATETEILRNTHSASIDVFDDYGTERRLILNFRRDDLNQWRMTATLEPQVPEDAVTNLTLNVGAIKIDTNNELIVNFDNRGTLLSVTEAVGANPATDIEGALETIMSFTLPNGEQRQVVVSLGQVGNVRDSITQFSAPTTTYAYFQDGYEMGYLESFRIDNTGTITGAYTNGERRILGQVGLAAFVNPGGLTKEGESLFTESNNSGIANVGAPGTIGRGKVYAGALEMSNVDLSETFTDMIVTERGFQANSRVVTTSDDMLREILALKR